MYKDRVVSTLRNLLEGGGVKGEGGNLMEGEDFYNQTTAKGRRRVELRKDFNDKK